MINAVIVLPILCGPHIGYVSSFLSFINLEKLDSKVLL